MNELKKLFKNQLTSKLSRNLLNLVGLIINFYKDGKLYYKHSMVFELNAFNKIESRIIILYHSIEKGFLNENFKYRFGESKVIELIKLLKYKEICGNFERSQIAAGYLALCRYYEKHQTESIDISDYFKKEDYELFKSLSTLNLNLIEKQNRSDFFNKRHDNFLSFSQSRASVRSFTNEKIPFDLINKVIELAKSAPSVCNRQSVKVYYLENKDKISRILKLQNGLTGFSDEVLQLLILVSDRNYFYTIGERNQPYVDGGIFLMNLLYALHYYGIGACPAHWCYNYSYDERIRKEVYLKDSEKVICLVPIGIPKEVFMTTLSLRRCNEEILKVVS